MFVENMVRATLISNAGLLLEYRGVKILVDAIYHTTDPFGNPRQLCGPQCWPESPLLTVWIRCCLPTIIRITFPRSA